MRKPVTLAFATVLSDHITVAENTEVAAQSKISIFLKNK